ncbi:hypothetical protein FLM08_07775 [Vibrio cholerae]|uniref:hypothetical protein n=1 Tax=Vibrio cholerae TaxID=666 RepID=UPI0011585E0F|nr:hypothetical protein [Vibrio cholerae]TQO66039.1 hypothetical protein FLM08_07775 [Vibrio cholerae]HDI3292398.1 hypothetical protein [Vibrio cholerae]
MIEAIYSNTDLRAICRNEVKENNARVNLDSSFYFGNGGLNHEKIINLAVDEYYNGLGLANTPPSIDNLLVINRGDNKFALYLIELKDVKKLSRLCNVNIKSKFNTTINDFMLERFKSEFDRDDVKITDLNLWLVCNRFSFMNRSISDEDYEKRIKNTIIEKLMLVPPFKYKGKVGMLNAMFNNAEIC